MIVKIKRIDKSLPLPKYETPGAVGFDFIVRQNTEIPARSYGRALSNIVVQVPAGYMLWVTDRSSTLAKKGLLITEGVIDQDYRGDNDEILLQFYNPMKSSVIIERGERVAQGVFLAILAPQWEEAEEMGDKDRGGFGVASG